jgi:hypothetical protein
MIENLDANSIPWRHVHVRPYRLDRVIGRKRFDSGQAETGRNPHSLEQYGKIAALIKALVMALDAWTLWFDRLRMRKHGGVLLIERSIIDLFIDPIRYGVSRLPSRLLLRLSLASLVSDVIVLCRCSPDLAFARKGEINTEEIVNQYCRWDELANHRGLLGPVVQIDTGTHPGVITLDWMIEIWHAQRAQDYSSNWKERVTGCVPR